MKKKGPPKKGIYFFGIKILSYTKEEISNEEEITNFYFLGIKILTSQVKRVDDCENNPF